jgi:hypothetical protein
MKILILVLLLFACSEDTTVQMGCQTGIIKGTTIRVAIRCCTKEQHSAGNNVAKGGTANFTDFTSIQWVPIDDCKYCF